MGSAVWWPGPVIPARWEEADGRAGDLGASAGDRRLCPGRGVLPVALCRVARSRALVDWVGYGAHALMCASMVAMVWVVPLLGAWQMALFAVVGSFFAVQATGVPRSGLTMSAAGRAVTATRDFTTAAHFGWGGRLRCVHHALVMAAMVWMLRAMTPGVGRTAPGMVMGSRSTTGPATVAGTYCAGVALLMLTSVGVAAVRRRGLPGHVRDDLAHGLMGAGMAAMLFAMA